MKTFFGAFFGAFFGTLMAFAISGFILIGVVKIAADHFKTTIQKVQAEQGLTSGQLQEVAKVLQQIRQITQGLNAATANGAQDNE